MSVAELPGSSSEFERTPPHDMAAEQCVLGGMMLSKDAISDVVEILQAEDYYRPAHQVVFDAIIDLYARGEPVDPVTCAAELTKRNELQRAGGAPYLHTLISSVPTAANAGYYAKIVRERAILRRLIEAGTRIVQIGYSVDGEIDEAVDAAQAEIYNVTENRSSEDYHSLSDVMPGALDEIEAIGSRGGAMVGVPTGFSDLDGLMNGLHPGQLIVVAARPAMGKAFALNVRVPTPAGWTTMGDVKVGDELIGADGRPTRVVAATDVMHGRPCYEIEFSDGEVLVADAQHEWRTTTRASRRQQSEHEPAHYWQKAARERVSTAARDASSAYVTCGEALDVVGEDFRHALHIPTRRLGRLGLGEKVRGPGRATRYPGRMLLKTLHERPSRTKLATRRSVHRSVKTTAEIARTLRCPGDGRPNHAIGVAAPFQFPRAALPIDPYVLGAWLGDGDSGGGTITCSDPEIIERIAAAGERVTEHAAAGRYGMLGLRRKLIDLGVLRNRHVPRAYLRASEEQRRALLAGMLDIDGFVSPTGQIQLGFVNPKLAEDAHELILSLGYRATMTTKPVKDRKPETSTFYRISFTTSDQVFYLPRKVELLPANVDPQAKVRYIVDVRPVESVPVRCVEVDNADHMYLAGRSCIPTHNSTLGLDFARAASLKNQMTSVIFSLEMSRNEITMRLLSAEARVPLHTMRSGLMSDDDWTRMARRMSEVAEAPMFIDDSPNMSMMEIRAKCRRLKQRHDLKLIIIDYLQLMTSGKRVESRQVEVSEFSRALKLLAKELEVPVVAVSQLNRGPEQRTDKKPMVSDLRESGCVTAGTRLMRADTNAEVTVGELLASGARDVPVWALDERLKLVPRTMTHVFSTGRKEVFRVRLRSGKEVETTAGHPFLTLDGWTPLGELAAGSRVGVPRHVPPPIDPRSMDENEVVLLAHLLGDGSFVKRQPIRYASVDEANLEAVTEAAARRFGITAVRDEYAAARVTSLRLPAPYRLARGKRNPIAEWLDEMGLFGLRSHEKFIPDQVFRLAKCQIAVFLRHLWATGGSVTFDQKGNRRIYFGSTSRPMLDGIARLLLRVGIPSRIYEVTPGAHRPQYTLDIAGRDDQLVFVEKIGVHGARGFVAAALAKHLWKVKHNASIDTVPHEVWHRVRQVLTEQKMSQREFAATVGTQPSALWKRAPSRDRLSRVANVLDADDLEMLATNDIFWDEIAEIESLGVQDVYDATVMGVHNFVANGISVHNSIEQDADVVILLHREDAYEKESPRAGEADLIVAKHRNGPTANVTVAFQGHYSRFVDMAPS